MLLASSVQRQGMLLTSLQLIVTGNKISMVLKLRNTTLAGVEFPFSVLPETYTKILHFHSICLLSPAHVLISSMDGESCQGCFCALVALKFPESIIAWHTVDGP